MPREQDSWCQQSRVSSMHVNNKLGSVAISAGPTVGWCRKVSGHYGGTTPTMIRALALGRRVAAPVWTASLRRATRPKTCPASRCSTLMGAFALGAPRRHGAALQRMLRRPEARSIRLAGHGRCPCVNIYRAAFSGDQSIYARVCWWKVEPH